MIIKNVKCLREIVYLLNDQSDEKNKFTLPLIDRY